jgi:hypothetical protein
MQHLQGAGAQVVALQCEGADRWPTQQRQFFCLCHHAGAEQGRIGGKWPRQAGPIYSSIIDGDAVTGGRPGSHAKMG